MARVAQRHAQLAIVYPAWLAYWDIFFFPHVKKWPFSKILNSIGRQEKGSTTDDLGVCTSHAWSRSLSSCNYDWKSLYCRCSILGWSQKIRKIGRSPTESGKNSGNQILRREFLAETKSDVAQSLILARMKNIARRSKTWCIWRFPSTGIGGT